MNLQEFVTQTLSAIINGVRDAKDTLGDAHVNPIVDSYDCNIHGAKMGHLMDERGNLIRNVDFDVAVTASEETETKGGIGVFVAGIGLGSQGQVDKGNASVSRVKFTIPVSLP